MQIAIDGPAGSGKSTIARLLAKKLGYLYIDSGAMYRAITLHLIKNRLLDKKEKELFKHIKKINIKFKNVKNKQFVFLNNKNVSKEIRTLTVSKLVSKVSSIGIIRSEMVKRQKEFALKSNVIMDGRDIGTTVFRNASLKIYLTASAQLRAKRRKKDLKSLSENISLKELLKQIQTRDDFDSNRKISPLCKSHDAIVIDSSNITPNEVLKKISLFLPIN